MVVESRQYMSARWPVPFWKMSGAGNDFVLIDHREPLVRPENMPEFARLVCRPKFGVGADGLIFIEKYEQADFRWRFFNADGSEAEMCGNGARCAARFAFLQGLAPENMRFATLAGMIEALVEGEEVTITLAPPTGLILNRKIQVAGREYTGHLVNTGVPHLIVFVDNLAATEVRRLGSLLRHHPAFAPAGVNVNFVQVQADGLHIRTYERGVENETYACGTGAAASALIASALKRINTGRGPVVVTTSGGVQLGILLSQNKAGEFSELRLKGPAHLIYKGELRPEALYFSAISKMG